MDVSIFDNEDFNFWVYDKSDQILGRNNLENLTQKEELILILRVHADFYKKRIMFVTFPDDGSKKS